MLTYFAHDNMFSSLKRFYYSRHPIKDFSPYEKKIFSQNGEDGVIEKIFSIIGSTNKYFVEFGVEGGTECNTRYLLEKKKWSGLWMDGGTHKNTFIKSEYVTAENINLLFQKYHVPHVFDILSIDIDSNDYWVWKAIQGYSPRLVVIEYNAFIPANSSKTIPYDPLYHWDGSQYFGASLAALNKIATEKGYTLIYCNNTGINAFFLRNDLLNDQFIIKPIEELYKPFAFGEKINGAYVGHPPSTKAMITV